MSASSTSENLYEHGDAEVSYDIIVKLFFELSFLLFNSSIIIEYVPCRFFKSVKLFSIISICLFISFNSSKEPISYKFRSSSFKISPSPLKNLFNFFPSFPKKCWIFFS